MPYIRLASLRLPLRLEPAIGRDRAPPQNRTNADLTLRVEHPPEQEIATSKFTDGQIIGILKEAEAGAPVTDLGRRIGISGHTFYRWRSKFGGMEVSEARRLRQVEDGNRELKQMVADLGLENRALKAALGKSGEPRAAPRAGVLPSGRAPAQRALGLRDRGAQSIGASLPELARPRLTQPLTQPPS